MTENAVALDKPGTVGDGVTETIYCDDPAQVYGRYVVIFITASNASVLAICEVQVYPGRYNVEQRMTSVTRKLTCSRLKNLAICRSSKLCKMFSI